MIYERNCKWILHYYWFFFKIIRLDWNNYSTKLLSPKDADCKLKVLETRVEIKNNSSTLIAIPHVYVSARALVDAENKNDKHFVGETSFEKLFKIKELSAIKNIAYFKNTISKLAPAETERFVRWDTIDESLIKRHPVFEINAEVFGFKYKFYEPLKSIWDKYINDIEDEFKNAENSDNCFII